MRLPSKRRSARLRQSILSPTVRLLLIFGEQSLSPPLRWRFAGVVFISVQRPRRGR